MARTFRLPCLVALWLALAGCASVVGESSVADVGLLEGRLWQLEAIVQADGTEQLPAPQDAITVFFEDGRAGGRTACNFYEGPYEVDGTRLDIIGEEMPITQAYCGEVAGPQETAFMDGLRAAERYIVEGERLTIFFADGRLVFGARPDTTRDPNAVYAGLLQQWETGKTFVFLDETQVNISDAGLDETLDAVQAQLQSFGGTPPLDPALLADFRARNATAQTLTDTLTIPYPVQFIREDELAALSAEGEAAGWQRFRERYPDAQAIYSLSRVGFNPAGDQALVFMGLRSEQDTGGFYHILERHNGIWVNTIGFRLEEP